MSAGILVYRRSGGEAERLVSEVLIGHPGGPLWARKDDGAWTIPKGECDPDELPADAARREFTEETGLAVPGGELLELGTSRQASGKLVAVWAVEGDVDADRCSSNHFEMDWPPRSGRRASFPEIDRLAWFDLATARTKLLVGQRVFLDRLVAASA